MFLRRTIIAAGAALTMLALSGCGPAAPTSMPDVVGLQLDVAKSDIERAGYSQDIEILGGGMFGVVDDRNWVVCEQIPAPGENIADPRLVVDRECAAADATAEPEDATQPVEPTDPADVAPVIDTTVDQLLDLLNAGGGVAGERYRFTGDLFHPELWYTGRTGDYVVLFSAQGGAQDLFVLMNEADAAGWTDGTRLEMVVENVEITLDGSTDDGWLRMVSATVVG